MQRCRYAEVLVARDSVLLHLGCEILNAAARILRDDRFCKDVDGLAVVNGAEWGLQTLDQAIDRGSVNWPLCEQFSHTIQIWITADEELAVPILRCEDVLGDDYLLEHLAGERSIAQNRVVWTQSLRASK